MTPDAEPSRRALVIVYHRYMRAERAFRLAQSEALSWFPTSARGSVAPIGDPGSRLRRLYERRERALLQLEVTHEKLNEARRRSMRRLRILALPAH